MHRHLIAAIILAVSFVTGISAHVVVTPREVEPGAQQTYTLRVHTDGTVSTTALELEVPSGLHVTEVASGAGFSFEVKKDGDRITAITWKRDIKPKESALFTFTAHNPQSGTLQWKIHQTFADGSVRHWIGDRGKKEPAPVTTISTKGAKPASSTDHEHKH
jgi:uncharacterized protein YcnI